MTPVFPSSFVTGSVFLSAKDGQGYATIWQSAVPFDTTSWKRIFISKTPFAGSTSLKNNPGWATTPAMFFFEADTVNGQVYTSQDGGVSWTTRNGPTGVGYSTAVARDAQTVYYCDTAATGNVYKSTNAGWTWSTAVSAGVGKINSINLPKANQVVVAGASVAISNDDAATFTMINTSLPAGTTYTLTADSAYATNNTMYTVDTTAVSYNIYRVKTDATTNAWEQMASTVGNPGRILGITCRSGILYATTNVIADGVLRTLYPTDLIGNQNWQKVNGGNTALPTAIATGIWSTAGINLYARVATSNTIYAFNDYLGATKPTLTNPDDNYNDAVNPSGGNGYPFDIKIKALGTGTSQVDVVQIEIADKANGLVGQPTNLNGGFLAGTGILVAPTNPFVTVGTAAGSGAFTFQPNKSYQIRVRAAHTTSGQFIDSPWSDARTINIQSGSIVSQGYAGPQLLGPQGGAQGLDPASVGFSWAPVSGASEYQIIVATDAGLTKTHQPRLQRNGPDQQHGLLLGGQGHQTDRVCPDRRHLYHHG
jgi:hypothetical protein